MNDKNVKISKGGAPGTVYRLFSGYVKLMHNFTYYRKNYVLGKENIPQNCPLLVVSDHQNSLNDALGLIFAINSRGKKKIRAITRADAFEIPFLGFVMRGVGLLPAFRIQMGVESLAKNADAIDEAANELLDDGTIIIYPESGHQDKRWLGNFTYGYLKLIFDAAEKGNFQKEMFILPSCNHYSEYLEEQEDILIKFGKPISIAPYYERYKTQPRTVKRELNVVVRQQVADLMLNIEDLDNYQAIDFLRNTYGRKYAAKNSFCPNNLSDKLLSDKQFVKALETLKSTDEETIQSVYSKAIILDNELKKLKIVDDFFDNKPETNSVYTKLLIYILLLPIYLFACISAAPALYLPKIIKRKINDVMLHGSVKQAVSVLVGIPLTNIAVFFAGFALAGSVFAGLIYMVCVPFLYIFAIKFGKTWTRCIKQIRFIKLLKQGRLEEMTEIRTMIHKTLDGLFEFN